jgi:phosphoserine phosphatase RsbU/P
VTDFSSRRLVVLFRRTSPLDRAAVLILALYPITWMTGRLGHTVPFASFLGFLSLLIIVYLCVRLFPLFRARLLWSLRNRLIVAYIFMAVVPVILLLTMVGVAGYLLELQIGAHMLQDDLQNQISGLAADTNSITAVLNREPNIVIPSPPGPPPVARRGPPPNASQSAPTSQRGRGGRGGPGGRGGRGRPPAVVAAENDALSRPDVAGVITAAKNEWPEMAVFLNEGGDLLQTQSSKQLSTFVEFQGRRLFLASVERLTIPGDHPTVLVVAPVTPALLNSFPARLGPIRLTLLAPAATNAPGNRTFNGISYALEDNVSSSTRVLASPKHWFDLRIDGVATFQALKAGRGSSPTPLPVFAEFTFRLSDVSKDLLTSVGELGPFLVTFLILAGVVFVVLECAALVTGFMLTRTITSSVGDLYQATLHVRRGDFGYRVRILERDQLGALGDSFNEMTGSVSELIEEQGKRQKLENEVSIAQEVQQHLFPTSVPSVPGLQVAAVCKPARTVSGDYYDFISLGPTRVGIALADISGKGIFAALLMASVQAALRSTAMLDPQLGSAEITSHLNAHLFKNTADDRYATFFFGIYDSEAKTLTYTNAGHLPPYFVTDSGIEQFDCGGTVIGLFEESVYTEKMIKVPPGSLLVAYSDGLTEVENVYGEEFGMLRLKEEVLRQRKVVPGTLVDNLVSAAEQWAGTPEQADDITVVVARMG